MEYKYMIPPFDFDKFEDLSKKQTEEYFQWYVSQIDYRIKLLYRYIISGGVHIDFDNTPESLIPLWEWYEQKITMVDKTEEEFQKEREETPDYIEVPKTKISMETWKIGMDLALYFADVMIRNNTGKVYWGYFTKPKNRMSVKRPVLLGFKADKALDPRLIVVNCTKRSSEGFQKTRLYEIYKTWIGFID